MKREPKTFKFPRIYRQHGNGNAHSYGFGPRTRIVYPDGRVEWWSDRDGGFDVDEKWEISCFAWDTYLNCYLCVTGEQALREMRAYDEAHMWSAAEFIGEIK